ncbi:MAG TPA: tetratricopeptide repeat protein [Oleiagrimonas sp.]|nr:tetratricopeptide repeat protein [Oleiagrimonas sp.]
MLVACSQPPVQAPKPEPSGAEMVAAIRAAGAKDDSVVRVKPLREPGVDHLLAKAQQRASKGRYEDAAAALDKALKLAPSPDILQKRAELAVRLGDYGQAGKLARRSYRLGPKVGGLCARNWQTVLEMRRIAGDAAGVAVARKAVAKCEESGPVRM